MRSAANAPARLIYENIFKVAKINMSRLSPNMHPIFKSGVIKLLNGKQIYTVLDFLKADTKLIEKASRLTFREILDVRKELIKRFSAQPRNGFEYYKQIISNSAIIETGIQNLDTLLGGGLFTGNIYEICGLPASGKTLFCLTLMKNVVSNMKENIYYLDAKQDFSGRKFKQMLCNLSKQDLVESLSKALIKNISSKHDLVDSLFEIKEKLQSGLKLRAIIIDSLPALYWQTTDHLENNSFLNHTINILRYLCVECNIVVVVTNLITLWNEGGFNTQDSYREKVACGGYWYNVPNVRLKFERARESACKVTLMKTWKIMPDVCECKIELTEDGIK